MYSQQYLDNLDSNQYDEFLFWSGQISKKGLDSDPTSVIMDPMKEMNDIEIQGDLRDEYLAIQEAETSDEPVMASDEEIKALLQEMWDEMLAPEPEEEYTEEDAYRDFHANTYEEFN
jgi:hypothetical protein